MLQMWSASLNTLARVLMHCKPQLAAATRRLQLEAQACKTILWALAKRARERQREIRERAPPMNCVLQAINRCGCNLRYKILAVQPWNFPHACAECYGMCTRIFDCHAMRCAALSLAKLRWVCSRYCCSAVRQGRGGRASGATRQ